MHYGPQDLAQKGARSLRSFSSFFPLVPSPPLAPRARLPYQGQIPAGPFARQWPKFTFYVSPSPPSAVLQA